MRRCVKLQSKGSREKLDLHQRPRACRRHVGWLGLGPGRSGGRVCHTLRKHRSCCCHICTVLLELSPCECVCVCVWMDLETPYQCVYTHMR